MSLATIPHMKNRKRCMQLYMPLVFACWLGGLAQAQEPPGGTCLIDAEETTIELGQHLYVLEDPEGTLSLDDVLQPETQARFKAHLSGASSKPAAVYWGRLTLQSRLPESSYWQLMLIGNYVDAYVQYPDGHTEHKTVGSFRPVSKLDIPYDWFRFRLKLPPNAPVTVVYRVENTEKPVFNIWPVLTGDATQSERWAKLFYTRNLLQGLFHGMLWIMVIYNLLVYFSSRDKPYLYYALYLSAASVYFLYRQRILLELLLAEVPVLSIYVWAVSLWAVSVCYYLFMRSFFDAKNTAPHVDRLIKIWVVGKTVFLLVAIGTFYVLMDTNLMLKIGFVAVAGELALTPYILARLWKQGRKIAPYFIIGSSVLVAFVLLYAFYFFGTRINVFAWDNNMVYLPEAGILIEIVFFSLGLAHRMRLQKEEKLQAQEALIAQLTENSRLRAANEDELRRKVETRTTEISQKNLELEQRNAEIMAQRDMLEAQKNAIENTNDELNKLNEEKNYLIGIVAHDLRNPLASAMSMSELLRKEADGMSGDQLEYLELIGRSLNRMNGMIGRILDLRQIEKQAEQVSLQACSLRDLINESLRPFRQQAQLKQIGFRFDVPPVKVVADHGFAVQVFENLISNAVKFSPGGATVAVWAHENGHGKIHLCVEDGGPGFTDEDMEKLFGKYQRLSAQPTNGESSTGLGLSIVKKYVLAMKGRVWCQNVPPPGSGALFTVELDMA